MHFILHIPDCSPSDLSTRAKSAGVADLLGGHDVLQMESGPAGTGGLNIAWLRPGDRMHYDPANQNWLPSHLKIDDKPAYWLGFSKTSPPTEGELRRVVLQDGQLEEFAGHRWRFPTPATVDAEAVYRADGTMFWEPIAAFSWMCEEAKRLTEQYLKPEEQGTRLLVYAAEPSVQIEWLTKLLRVNYRITPEVCQYLHFWVGRQKILRLFLSTIGMVLKEQSNG